MEWLSAHLPGLAAGLSSCAGAAVAVLRINHLIAESEELLHGNAWQFLKALFSKQPVTSRAQLKEGTTMDIRSINTDLEIFKKTAEDTLEVVCKLEGKVGPVLQLFEPQLAPEIAIANGLASSILAIIQEHEAAGSTPQSAAVALNKVATAVATSGAVDASTAEKITQLAPAVSTLAPDILQALTSA